VFIQTLDGLWTQFRWFLARTLSIVPLVFLRKNMGARFITVPHVLMGAVTLGFGVMLEGADITDLEKAQSDAPQIVAECHDDVRAVMYAGYRCADTLPLAHWRIAHPPLTFPLLMAVLGAFVLAGLAQLVVARLRVRHTDDDDVLSYDGGEPLLAALTFGRFPALAKIILEPLLVGAIACCFLFYLRRYRTFEFLGVVACSMCVLAIVDWVRNFNATQTLLDWASRMGIGQGSMKRTPTRPAVRGGFLRDPEEGRRAGIARLRAFAAQNRARMLEGTEEPSPGKPPAPPDVPSSVARQDAPPKGGSPAPAMDEPQLPLRRI